MFCPKCGKELPDKFRFCSGCGAAVELPPAPQPVPQSRPQPTPQPVTQSRPQSAPQPVSQPMPQPAPWPGASAVKRLYMEAKGLTVMNYKFEIRDEMGYLRYRAGTVTESAFTYNARVWYPDDSEAMAIHQQKKMTVMAMNFDIVAPNGALVTRAMQKVDIASYIYELPELGITVDGDFLALNFRFHRNGQPLGKVSKKLMAWGDCYEVEFYDSSLEQVFLSVVMVIQMVIAASRNRRRRRRGR